MLALWHARPALLFLALLICVPGSHGSNDAAESITYRTTVSEVRVTFFATDEQQHPVATLTNSDFAVVDNDRVVRNFPRGWGPGRCEPIGRSPLPVRHERCRATGGARAVDSRGRHLRDCLWRDLARSQSRKVWWCPQPATGHPLLKRLSDIRIRLQVVGAGE